MISIMGVFLTLACATFTNISQILTKPQGNLRKWFIIFGGVNLTSAAFFSMYSMHKLGNLYLEYP